MLPKARVSYEDGKMFSRDCIFKMSLLRKAYHLMGILMGWCKKGGEKVLKINYYIFFPLLVKV